MNVSPEDDVPIPSEPILSEKETIKQLRADMVRQYVEQINLLEAKLLLAKSDREKWRNMAFRLHSILGCHKTEHRRKAAELEFHALNTP